MKSNCYTKLNPNFDLRAEFMYPIKPLQGPLTQQQKMTTDDENKLPMKTSLSKSRNVFPLLKHEGVTMIIFSYIDVHHRALDILKRLNSKGYDICKRQHLFKSLFAVYLKSQIVCKKIRQFQEEDIFTLEVQKAIRQHQNMLRSEGLIDNFEGYQEDHNDTYQFMDNENPVTQNHQGIALNLPNIAMQTIDLYSAKRGDATYPRGISILYQVDGQKSYQLNYVDQDAGNGERGMYYEQEND